MTFKEAVRMDIDQTFMNLDEFAWTHMVNGRKIPAVVDSNELIEREKKAKSDMDGIYAKQTLIYVKAKDFGKLPAVGSTLLLDGRTYIVVDAINEDGLYSITLEANRS